MINIKNKIPQEKITGLILKDDIDSISWCVYYPDDGNEKLIFSKNKKDLNYLEDFEGYTEKQIISHLNTYGFDIESQDEYGDVIEYKNLPENFSIKITQIIINKTTNIKFKL